MRHTPQQMNLTFNPSFLEQELSNCTAKIQEFSVSQNELLGSIKSANDTTLLLAIILGSIFLLFFVHLLYNIFRNRFAYRLGFVRNNSIEWIWRWNVFRINKIKHSGKDVFNYVCDPETIYGRTLLWFYHNPRPIVFDGQNNMPTSKDMIFDTLNKSTVIEKFVTAEDFMNLIKILIIVIIVLVIIGLVLSWMGYSKEMICNLIVENKTMLTSMLDPKVI